MWGKFGGRIHNQVIMRDELKSIFQNVNEWLKFAEAKHAGLIVLSSGMIFGVLTIYKDYHLFLPKLIILLTILFFVLSVVFSIISLFPRTCNKLPTRNGINNPNLYFAGHLCKLNEDGLKMELLRIHPNYIFNKFEEDLINQIIVNATIATKKYQLFKFATISVATGFIILLGTILIKIIWHF